MTILQYLLNLFMSLHQPQEVVSHDRMWTTEVDLLIDPADVYDCVNYNKQLKTFYTNIVLYCEALNKLNSHFLSHTLCDRSVLPDRLYTIKMNQFFQNTSGVIIDPNIAFSRFLLLVQELDVLMCQIKENDNDYLVSKKLDVLLRWSKPVLNEACNICSNFIEGFHEPPRPGKR